MDRLTGIYARGVLVSDEEMALIRLGDLSGLGNQEPICFRHRVLWLLHTESRYEFRHGGQVIATDGQETDYHGFLKSMSQCRRRAETAAEHYGINTSSTAVIAVVTKLIRHPVLPNSRYLNAFSPDHVEVPQGWWLDTQNTRD